MTRSSNGGLFSFCWRTVDSSHWREMNRFSISFDFLAWITHTTFVNLKDNFSSRETQYTLITDTNMATASARKRSFKKKVKITLIWSDVDNFSHVKGELVSSLNRLIYRTGSAGAQFGFWWVLHSNFPQVEKLSFILPNITCVTQDKIQTESKNDLSLTVHYHTYT